MSENEEKPVESSFMWAMVHNLVKFPRMRSKNIISRDVFNEKDVFIYIFYDKKEPLET